MNTCMPDVFMQKQTKLFKLAYNVLDKYRCCVFNYAESENIEKKFNRQYGSAQLIKIYAAHRLKAFKICIIDTWTYWKCEWCLFYHYIQSTYNLLSFSWHCYCNLYDPIIVPEIIYKNLPSLTFLIIILQIFQCFLSLK